MKKKLLSLLLITFIFTLVACGGSDSKEGTIEPAPEPTDEANLTGNVFLDAETESHILEGGGTSSTIIVSKQDALAASEDDYAAFISARLSPRKNYEELFGLLFNDGTGVTYYGCDASNAVYGQITYKGVSIEAFGYIAPNDDGTYTYNAYDEESNPETDSTVQTLLENIYQIGEGVTTTVSVEDGKASVWLIGNFSFGSAEEKDQFVSSFTELHNTAKDIIATQIDIGVIPKSYVLSTTICNSSSIPLYCIEDGETLFDFITIPE